MLRWIVAGFGAALFAVIVFSGSSDITAAQKKEVVSIEEIMKRINKPKGLHKLLAKEMESKDIRWDEVQKMTKEYALLAADLGKNKVEKGSPESWAKLCKEYADNAKALETAAAKKDAKGVLAAHGKLTDSCGACHKVHR